MADDLTRTVKRALRNVDWPRAMHRVGLLLRELRGDRDVDTDHHRERERASDIKQSYGRAVRSVTGCDGSARCPCALCEEDRS